MNNTSAIATDKYNVYIRLDLFYLRIHFFSVFLRHDDIKEKKLDTLLIIVEYFYGIIAINCFYYGIPRRGILLLKTQYLSSLFDTAHPIYSSVRSKTLDGISEHRSRHGAVMFLEEFFL